MATYCGERGYKTMVNWITQFLQDKDFYTFFVMFVIGMMGLTVTYGLVLCVRVLIIIRNKKEEKK
jgi:hypothetical protein